MPLYVFTPNRFGRCFCAPDNAVFASFAADEISTLLESTFAPYFLQTAQFNTDEIFGRGKTMGTLSVTCPALSVAPADYTRLRDAQGRYNGPTRTLEVGEIRLSQTKRAEP